MQEILVRKALTLCALPTEPWSLNPYVGCLHGCAYCYVPDVAHLERPRWGSYVVVKRNLPQVLSREVKHLGRRQVFISSATDPYQSPEAEHRITRKCLEILARAQWPLRVLTRSPLVLRDVDVLRRFSDVGVGFSVPTLDDEARRLLEPRAPPIEGRLDALRKLADAGLPTSANLVPTYPLTGGIGPRDVARAFHGAGVRDVYAGPWRYLPSVLPSIRQRLAGSGLEGLAAAAQDPMYFERLVPRLRRAFDGVGITLHVYDGFRAARARAGVSPSAVAGGTRRAVGSGQRNGGESPVPLPVYPQTI